MAVAALITAQKKLQSNLVSIHLNLVHQLEAKYDNQINKLLAQKAVVLNNLQSQLITQMNMIDHEMNNLKKQSIKEAKKKNDNDHSRYTPIRVNADYITPSAKKQSNTKSKCPHCEYATNHSGNLKIHIRIHSGEKPFVCSFDGCNKRFTKKWNLNDHIKRHIGDKRFKCLHCCKEFVTKQELTQHLHRVHSVNTGQRSFGCKHCKEKFKNKACLQFHSCKTEKKKNQIIDLTADHITKSKKEQCKESDHGFVCLVKYCKLVFPNEYSLNEHMKMHFRAKKFKCLHCGKGFGDKCTLRTHINGKVCRKKFVCKYCHQIFDTNNEWVAHIDSKHLNDDKTKGQKGRIPPFECMIKGCKLTFKDKQSFNEHIKQHHLRTNRPNGQNVGKYQHSF